MLRFEYQRLGDFTYHVLDNPNSIRTLLTRWIVPEWEADHQEDPDQEWTVEWLQQAPFLVFKLAAIPLADIQPRTDLMSFETAHYSFRGSLERRANEREQAMLRGVSIEPSERWEGDDLAEPSTVRSHGMSHLVSCHSYRMHTWVDKEGRVQTQDD